MTEAVPTEAHTGSMYLKGKDSQTSFFGQTNPMNIYPQVTLTFWAFPRSLLTAAV